MPSVNWVFFVFNMKFTFSIVLVALISLAVSGRCFILRQNETDKTSKIEGGHPICIKEVPWQVMIKVEGQYICGGALIAPNIVLTAAHCIYPTQALSVVAGTHSTKLYFGHSFFDGSVNINAEQTEIHPQYNRLSKNSHYDLALIMLADNFPISSRIKPISLPKQNVKVNEELFVTGFGLLEAGSDEISSCLMYYIPKVKDCRHYELHQRNGEHIICHEGQFGSRTHRGDSGSPMVNRKRELVGIHSGTYSKGKFQIAINVYHFLDWIDETMKKFMSNEV